MAWLYLPPDAIAHGRCTAGSGEACSDCPSAPEPEASTSDSISPTPDIELWVTSSGKPTRRPRSWRGWKTRPWIARLSGTTLPPSTADLGAAWWIWPTATATDAHVTRARAPEKMIRKDGRNVLRTPSLAETVMQPNDFPYTKQDLELAKAEQPYRVAKAHWPTPRAHEPGNN
ncbi:MAG TPA: hypothetical protein PKX87_05100, partial [Alphaproteobacteria bacterium]|nr:hypothetical protein [Alphaproteobacteria bacterium]